MSQEISAERILRVGDTHHIDLPMRWGDADALNHMNNTVYFRLMEEARIQMLYGSRTKLPANQGFNLVHASCDFARSFTYPCDVRVTHVVTRIGNSSLETELLLSKVGDDSEPYARGRTVVVWVDFEAGRAIPLPAEVLRAMASQCEPGAPA